MKVLKVEDMHCGKCVERISNALKDVDVEFEVSLENKTVKITNDSDLEKAVSELDDLGFDAIEV